MIAAERGHGARRHAGFVLEKFGLMDVRADLGPVDLINFCAVAYGLTWLLIYVWHVVIVYMACHLDARTPELSQLVKTLMTIVAVGILAIPALWRDRDRIVANATDLGEWIKTQAR